ncbi:MAG TPA: glycosyltransferase family 2 protein [Paludibacter sp.]|nr:glycosyltransferase family 2 protein [Paludibacter sp.]
MNNTFYPLVSIITVCYNSAKTIEQTILSVVHQTYSNIEYIIIDGGSTDGTLDIIEKYSDRIAYFITEPDNGIYDAMNKGVRAANGEMIGIINSDDWYELSAIEKIVDIYSKNRMVDVIHGGIRMYDNEKYLTTYCPKIKQLNLCMIPHPACFVTKAAYTKYGNYNLKYKIAADYELMARIYSSNGSFVFCNKILANLRMGGTSDLHKTQGGKESEEIKGLYKLNYQISLQKHLKIKLKMILKI